MHILPTYNTLHKTNNEHLPKYFDHNTCVYGDIYVNCAKLDRFRVGLLLEMYACLVLARVGMVDPGEIYSFTMSILVENLGNS